MTLRIDGLVQLMPDQYWPAFSELLRCLADALDAGEPLMPLPSFAILRKAAPERRGVRQDETGGA